MDISAGNLCAMAHRGEEDLNLVSPANENRLPYTLYHLCHNQAEVV